MRAQLADARTQVIITTGGTGITSRDGTFEAVDGLLEKRLDGFGELFRMLSFQEIGSAAMMSRATAGTAGAQGDLRPARLRERGAPGDDAADPPGARTRRAAVEPMRSTTHDHDAGTEDATIAQTISLDEARAIIEPP